MRNRLSMMMSSVARKYDLVSSGAQFINTGYIPASEKLRIEIDIIPRSGNNNNIFGVMSSTSSFSIVAMIENAFTTRIYVGSSFPALSVVLNDKELQLLALSAVVETAKKGLKGDEAYKDAFGTLSHALTQRGEIIATNVIDTLLQTAVTVQRNSAD